MDIYGKNKEKSKIAKQAAGERQRCESLPKEIISEETLVSTNQELSECSQTSGVLAGQKINLSVNEFCHNHIFDPTNQQERTPTKKHESLIYLD